MNYIYNLFFALTFRKADTKSIVKADKHGKTAQMQVGQFKWVISGEKIVV